MKKVLGIVFVFCLGINISYAQNDEQTLLDLKKSYLQIAASLAQIQNQQGACGGMVEVYTSDIIDAVRKAKNYHEIYTYTFSDDEPQAFKVPAIVKTQLQSTIALRELTTGLPRQAQDLEKVLQGVKLYGPSPGAFGNMSYVEFGQNNQIIMAYLEFDDNGVDLSWKRFNGTYKVLSVSPSPYTYEAEVEFLDAHGISQIFVLRKDSVTNSIYDLWHMVPFFDLNVNPYLEGYVETPSECSA